MPTPSAPRLIETVRASWAMNLESSRRFAESDPSRRDEYLAAAAAYEEAIAILDAGVAQVRGAK